MVIDAKVKVGSILARRNSPEVVRVHKILFFVGEENRYICWGSHGEVNLDETEIQDQYKLVIYVNPEF